MHISLDSALGRQRRLNSVGESVFQIAPNAAAGYSLRSLTGGDPAVVRVRRESDNAERDFNASGVSSGELVNWVNQQITPPLDLRELTATGRDGPIIDAAAAYSLRNLSDSYTGNVVDVRRSSDDATRSFTAAEVADGTLTDWVNVGKNYVGYARFQNSTTSNVNLTSSFTLEPTNNWSIKFGYIGGSTNTGLFGSSGSSNTGFWFGNLHTLGITDDSGFFSSLNFASATSLKIGQHHEIEVFNTPAEGVRVTIDGITMSGSPKIYGDITLNRVGLSRGRDSERVIENVRIDLNGDGTLDYSYAGDGNQASNWTDRVGSNNGTPTAQVLTYNNEFTSGFVSQWYDQSTTAGTPNANHAVQTDAASQPKIVDAGTLLDKLKFEGAQFLQRVFTSPLSQPNSSFVVAQMDAGTGNSKIFDGFGSTERNVVFASNGSDFVIFAGSTQKYADRDANENLHTAIFNEDSSLGALNGVVTPISGLGSQTAGGLTIGKTHNVATGFLTGTVSELIFYNSDQSDNRTAIEANIGEVYSIAGIPAYDDTVNGFVESWYDQSGNGNDAVQLTANNQPKIVDGGSLLNELLFEGSQLFDSIPLSSSAQPNSIFTVSNTNVASQTRGIYGTSASQAGYYRSSNRHFIFSTGTESSALEGSAYVTDRDYLRFDLFNGANSVVGVDGDTTSGTVGDGVLDRLDIGDSSLSGVDPLNGGIKELILYLSDQSANRAAIEANINNQYDIY